jgi:deaminated glutathione amidase
MKAAAIQMVSSTRVEDNLLQALSLLQEAAQAGAELAVLPEYFCLLGRKDTDKLNICEPMGDGPIQAFLAQTARNLKLWLVAGTLPIAPPGLEAGAALTQVFNTSLVFNPAGDCVASYNKMHLFRFDNGKESYDESRALLAGSQPSVFELPARDGHIWRIGLSVCYDLRFPELYRVYATKGVDLMLVPSAFTHTTGQAHWEVLLRARAIENLSYVLASAQGGLHENGRRTWGHSMLVDPWGRILAEKEEGVGVVLANLSKAQIDASRMQLPALTHRRL